MIAGKWEQIKDLFEIALDLSPEEQREFLRSLSLKDPTAANEVIKLLHSYEQAGEFLLQPCTVASEFLEGLEIEQYRFAPGDVLCGRFRVVDLIGQGGMGEVYKAWDEDLEDHIALKILRAEISTQELFTSRFRREIQLARKVTHPNVCRIFDSFKHPFVEGAYIPVLSMELLQGRTLAEHLKEKKRFEVAEALPIARQIINGLSAIHTAGIIHRDLKPANLFMAKPTTPQPMASEGRSPKDHKDGGQSEIFQIKITDFGIAGQIPETLPSAAHSEISRFLGTPDYMAPEQLEQGQTSIRSDIYSLGLVLYQITTGTKPFDRAPTWKRLTADPPSPRKIIPSLPENWNKTILCCLERNPEYRFQCAQAVLDGLEGTNSPGAIPRKPLRVRLARGAQSNAGRIAVFFLLLMALCAGVYRYFNQRAGISQGAMVFLANLRDDTKEEYFQGLPLALKRQLEQSARFEAVTTEDSRIQSVLTRMGRTTKETNGLRVGRDVALQSEASFVLFSRLSKGKQGYVLSIILERVRFTRYFVAAHWEEEFYPQDENDMRSVLQKIAEWVRNKAGESLWDERYQNRPLREISIPSWDAWRLLDEANYMVTKGDYPSAEVLLQRAIGIDSAFIEAHARLADVLISTRRDKDGLVEWQHTLAEIQRQEQAAAYQKRSFTNQEIERIKGQYYEDTGDYSRAQEAFRKLTDSYPNDSLGWFYLGSVLDKGGDVPGAEQAFLRAVTLRPDFGVAHAHLAMLYISVKDFKKANVEIAAAEDSGLLQWAVWLKAILAYTQGDFNRALSYSDELGAAPQSPFKTSAYSLRASMLADLGRMRQAMAVLEEGVIYDEKNQFPVERRDKLIGLGYLNFQQQELDQCKKLAAQAAEPDPLPGQTSASAENQRRAPSPRHRMEAGVLLARCGDIHSAGEQLSELETYPDVPLVRGEIERLRGEIALAGHHPEEGASAFEKAARLSSARDNQTYLAEALIALGKLKRAAEILKRVADDPGHTLLYRDHDFPGLWGDSLAKLISLEQMEQPTACAYMELFLRIRQSSDTSVGNGEILKTRQMFRHFCPSNN